LRPYGHLHDLLIQGEFVVTCEVAPPRSASTATIRQKARLVKNCVDAVNITDGQGAMARLASWAGCLALIQEGVEPVMQFQCRDRNRIALQADLLGAGSAGIPNITLMTGDHQKFGDHPDARGVFDLDSIQLIMVARTLRDKKQLLSKRPLGTAPKWLIGAVENPFAAPHEFRAERLGKKIAAGAEYVQTQYVFDLGIFRPFMDRVRDLGLDQRCYILAGVGPIMSRRALHYLTEELSGVYVPPEVVRRLASVPENRIQDEGLALCAETIQQLREIPGVSGVHVLAAGWEERLPTLLRRAGVERRNDSLAAFLSDTLGSMPREAPGFNE
jgi:methylenetetrahydrofolate reductase (NADPH)